MEENNKSIYLNKRMPKLIFSVNLENSKYLTIFADYKLTRDSIVNRESWKVDNKEIKDSWFFWFFKSIFSNDPMTNKQSKQNSEFKNLNQQDVKKYKSMDKNIIDHNSISFLQDLLKYLILKEHNDSFYERLLINKWNFNEQISKEFVLFLNKVNISFKQYLNIKIKKEELNTNLLNNYLGLISDDFYNYNSVNYKKYFNWISELPEFMLRNWDSEKIKNKLNLISYIRNLNKIKQLDDNSKKIFNDKIKVLEKNLEKIIKEEITEYYSVITNPLKNYLDDCWFGSSIDYNYFKEITSLSQKNYWI